MEGTGNSWWNAIVIATSTARDRALVHHRGRDEKIRMTGKVLHETKSSRIDNIRLMKLGENLGRLLASSARAVTLVKSPSL